MMPIMDDKALNDWQLRESISASFEGVSVRIAELNKKVADLESLLKNHLVNCHDY